jgi:hypothetical protein
MGSAATGKIGPGGRPKAAGGVDRMEPCARIPAVCYVSSISNVDGPPLCSEGQFRVIGGRTRALNGLIGSVVAGV